MGAERLEQFMYRVNKQWLLLKWKKYILNEKRRNRNDNSTSSIVSNQEASKPEEN